MDVAQMAMLKLSSLLLFGLPFLTGIVVTAQNLPTKRELAAIGEAQSTNQAKLSHYSWRELQFVSVNGEAVAYRLYGVSFGANGQYQRDLVTEHTGQAAAFEPKITEELSPYGPYTTQLCELANQYTKLNSERLIGAKGRGEIALVHKDGWIKLAITNYFKSGDSLAITINQHTHQLVSMQAKSYLDSQDAVTIQAEFAELPDGTNHVATAEFHSVSRHLTVKLTNWAYQ